MSYMPALGSCSLGFGVLGLEPLACVALTQGRTARQHTHTQNKCEARVQWGPPTLGESTLSGANPFHTTVNL